jgi:hypothetical protein
MSKVMKFREVLGNSGDSILIFKFPLTDALHKRQFTNSLDINFFQPSPSGPVKYGKLVTVQHSSVEGIMIQNTHESILGAARKRPVFEHFES